jgi:hypothetical protein
MRSRLRDASKSARGTSRHATTPVRILYNEHDRMKRMRRSVGTEFLAGDAANIYVHFVTEANLDG